MKLSRLDLRARFIITRVLLTLDGKTPTLSRTQSYSLTPAVDALVLSGQVPGYSFSKLITPAAVTLSLSGAAPAKTTNTPITPAAGTVQLNGSDGPLAGAAPAVNRAIANSAQGTLTLAGQTPTVLDAPRPGAGALSLTGQAGPTLTFTSQLNAGYPGLISLSIDYDLEFIATPTETLIT